MFFATEIAGSLTQPQVPCGSWMFHYIPVCRSLIDQHFPDFCDKAKCSFYVTALVTNSQAVIITT